MGKQAGNIQQQDKIIVKLADGSIQQLTTASVLSTALRCLRARGQLLPIFVDQICINQAKDPDAVKERSQQINLIGDIYRNCGRVIAWLDVATRDTEAFFDYFPQLSASPRLQNLSQNYKQFSAVLSAALQSRTEFPDDEELQQDVQEIIALARKCWDQFPHKGFLDVCLRRWFRRIWIIQEACLAQKIDFVCGDRSCSVQEIEMALMFQMFAAKVQRSPSPRSFWPKFTREFQHDARSAASLAYRLLQGRSQIQRPADNLRRTFISIVINYNVDIFVQGPWMRLGVSNPPDYIYGLKGLAASDDAIANALKSGYEKSAKGIFTEYTGLAARSWIDILLLSKDKTGEMEKLPSWVPDWSAYLDLPHGSLSGGSPAFKAGLDPAESTLHFASPGGFPAFSADSGRAETSPHSIKSPWSRRSSG